MRQKGFVAKTWNNGRWRKTGAGYGLEVSIADRDMFFDRSWKTVKLNLVGPVSSRMAEANIDKDSFWKNTCRACRELISKDIGKWLLDNRFAPWQGGRPRFWITPTNEREFEVRPYNE